MTIYNSKNNALFKREQMLLLWTSQSSPFILIHLRISEGYWQGKSMQEVDSFIVSPYMYNQEGLKKIVKEH